jgi:DNA polymerase III subunit epsilon
MKLEKPVVFFDIESTGVAPNDDRIVDIALVKRNADGSEEFFSSLVDPEMPIPPEAEAIHHISNKMVLGQPTFKQLAPKLLEFIGDADLGGFGVMKFDVPMLLAEFKRAGVFFPLDNRGIVDALAIFHRMEPRNLGAALKFYCGKTLEDAHRAEPDARASMEVFFAQLEKYDALPKTMAGLSAYCQQRDAKNVDAEGKFVWRNGKAAFNFGKHRTLTLDEVARKEPSYLQWLAGAEKTTPELAQICRNALIGIFPSKPEAKEPAGR